MGSWIFPRGSESDLEGFFSRKTSGEERLEKPPFPHAVLPLDKAAPHCLNLEKKSLLNYHRTKHNVSFHPKAIQCAFFLFSGMEFNNKYQATHN